MKIKLSNYVSQFLVDNNIKDCFMVTGGGAMHLDDALGHQEEINCIFNHHEQACAIAAEGYTRLTGKLAAVCVTSGPGGTNAITGVIGGWLDSIPMFVLSGQVKRETTIWSCKELGLRQLGDQEFDIAHTVANMTKYAVMVTEPNEIAYHLEKALALALDGRGGPVWLDIPLDVQGAMIDTDELIHFDKNDDENGDASDGENNSAKRIITSDVTKVSQFSGYGKKTASGLTTESDLENGSDLTTLSRQVLDKIYEAKAPLILAGTGIRLGDAEDELLKALDKLKIPVVTAWNANDTVAFDNPYFAGMPGTVGTRPGNFAVQNCDLLISLGCRMNIRMIGYNHFDFAKNAYKIVVDIDEKELNKPTVNVDMKINADVKAFLQSIIAGDYTPNACHDNWVKWCKNLINTYPTKLPSYHRNDGGLINPYVFMDILFDELREDDRIICGNGSACVMTFQGAKIKQGQRMFTNSGCAAMGYGFPAAVGVAVSDNSKRTICIDGDGSFMMNIQELATVKHNNLDMKIIIINNNGYHSIRQTQTNLFKPPFIGIDGNSGLSFPNFEKLSDAFGVNYFMLDSEENCREVLAKALSSEGPCIIEAVVDPGQNFAPKSSSKVLPDGKIVSPSLDDMAPFLDRDEFEKIKYIP